MSPRLAGPTELAPPGTVLARFLQTTAAWLLVLALAVWPATTIERAACLAAAAIGLAIVGLAALLHRHGKSAAAGWLYLLGFAAGAALCAAFSGGLQSPFVSLLAGLVMAAAALGGMRRALTLALGLALTLLLLAWGGRAGWFAGRLAAPDSAAAAIYAQTVTMALLTLWAKDRQSGQSTDPWEQSRARGAAAGSRSLFLWDCRSDHREYGEDLRILACRDATSGAGRALAEFDDAVKRALASLVGVGAPGFDQEFPVRIGGGDEFWLRAQMRVTSRDAAGNPLQWCGTLTEVTEFRQTREELVKARDRAQEAARAKAAFLANMSHEIRTPLSAIVGLSDILLSEPLDRRAAELVTLMQSSGRMLLSVINDILDLSRIEAGQLTLRREAVDPQACAREVLALLRHAAERKSLSLTYRAPEHPPGQVLADPARLRQILVNLLDNAIKFTQTGGVELACDWTPGENGEGILRFGVTDTGLGIPAEAQERIFQRFSQVDDSLRRAYGGTGLGLSICRHLAERMGGSIGFVSSPGVGSTFWIEIPATPVSPPAELRAPGAGSLPQYPQLRVLVVEDNATNRLVVDRLLGKFGIQPALAEDGEQAVALSTAEPFDLILMDVQMPGMDGLQASRAIRLCGNGTPLIVALTAHVLPEDHAACLAAGMDDFLSKPVDLVALGGILERCSGALARP